MNNPGSNVINKFEYSLGNDLLFNYTNANNLNWEVEKSGTYLINVLGAGSSGRGARVSGQLELVKGDLINLKIHSAITNVQFNRANGSSGSIMTVNGTLIAAAGGAGGQGARGDMWSSVTMAQGLGGKGGNGGLIGSSGGRGTSGGSQYGNNNGKHIGNLGGQSPSSGGSSSGSAGKTIYDGGSGGLGNADGERWNGGGGGGGAGGSSFVHESLVNPVISGGQNSGNGSVTMTLIKEK